MLERSQGAGDEEGGGRGAAGGVFSPPAVESRLIASGSWDWNQGGLKTS